MLRIEQGIIQRYTGPRTCNVLQIPDRYMMTDVRLKHTLSNQFKPLEGSTVLVVASDSYRTFLLTVLRDPIEFLENGNGIRGSNTEDESFLQAGEIFLEAAGTNAPKSGFSGTGGTMYLGNDGTVALKSGKQKEFLILGGEDTDDDGEVILTGDNGFFESNINHLTQVRSTYRFDEDNNVELGNFRTTVPGTGSITEIPIAHLTMDTTGLIVVESNNVLGLSQSSVTLQPSGILALNSIGQITANSSLINLNSGTFGVARKNDVVISNTTTDPAFWTFWTNQATIFTALPLATDPGTTMTLANALKTALIVLASTFPTSITGKINSASSSVKAG